MKFIKKTIATIATVVALALPMKAQSGTVEAITSLETGDSYLRPTISYQLPESVKGSSFHEFYEDGTHFGKTTLEKGITDDQGIKIQAKYGSHMPTKTGAGFYTKIPSPDDTFVKVSYIPLWLDLHGKKQDSQIFGYYVSVYLPLDMKLSSFGEIDIQQQKWTYGELGLEKKITDDLSISYQPSLTGDGDIIPKPEHRIDIKYKLK